MIGGAFISILFLNDLKFIIGLIFVLHSCWCMFFLFECCLNSNLYLNSNFVEVEIEKRKENRKQTQGAH